MASMRDVRERSQLRPRDQGTEGPRLWGVHPFGASRDKSKGLWHRLSCPLEGRPPYLLPPDTHGQASVPIWSRLSPQGSGRAKPAAKACLLGSLWAWPTGRLRRVYGEPPPGRPRAIPAQVFPVLPRDSGPVGSLETQVFFRTEVPVCVLGATQPIVTLRARLTDEGQTPHTCHKECG